MSLLRRQVRRARPAVGVVRVDARTKRLVQRLHHGEVAVIDHEDLDRVSAESLVSAGVTAVVNARRSITGRYPNLGPLILLDAGVTLVDAVGPLLMRKVHEGDVVRLDGDRVFVGEHLVGVGIMQSDASVREAMAEAQLQMSERFESFARNTLEYMQRERDLLFGCHLPGHYVYGMRGTVDVV